MSLPQSLVVAGCVMVLAACGREGGVAPASRQAAQAMLPAKFEDVVVYPEQEWESSRIQKDGSMKQERVRYVGRRAPFTMVLVPGDEAKGIRPFYLGETEVTWEMFEPWAAWQDKDLATCQKEFEADLRPSNIFPETSWRPMAKWPAMHLSRLTAEKYCLMLSEKTGRKYRLPTEAEWDHAYAAGGGDPASEEGKRAVAWCKENSDDYLQGGIPEDQLIYDCVPGKTGSKRADKLGLHDMLGNVAEWVDNGPIHGTQKDDNSGDGTVVRGGTFRIPAKELRGSWQAVAHQNEWNATFPQVPRSKWWYMTNNQVGFRLACDPVNLPEAKP